MGFSLIPRNDKYFEDFDATAAIVRELTKELRAATEGEKFPPDLWRKIKTLETKADEVVRRVHTRLDASFVTPIEREDIHLLIVTIDDVADTLTGAVSRLDIYGIDAPTDEMRSMVRTLDEMAEQMVIAVSSLRTLEPAKVREATGKLDLLEQKIDELHRDSLRKLFQKSTEARDLVRWKDVYDLLETAADYGRRVARTVNHILVRHS